MNNIQKMKVTYNGYSTIQVHESCLQQIKYCTDRPLKKDAEIAIGYSIRRCLICVLQAKSA